MESSSAKKSNRVINLQPNETVITAFPYEPQSSLLDFLKGETKLLGALQILLAQIILGIGIIFAFNFLKYTHKFPLVFITGYPFWGPFIFSITGCFSVTSKKINYLERSVMILNILSCLAAIAGIALTIFSYKYQYMYCQVPSLEGICLIGKILFNGILSVLLIITIAELSLSVSIASFRSRCWTKSNEIVFFLPMEIPQDSYLDNLAEENAVIQFELQEYASNDEAIANVQPVFIGGYTFYKLKVSKGLLLPQTPGNKDNTLYHLTSANGQQKKVVRSSSEYEDINTSNPLPIKAETVPAVRNLKLLSNKDLQFSEVPLPRIQTTQLLHASLLSIPASPTQEALPQILITENADSHNDQSLSVFDDKPHEEITPQDSTHQDIHSLTQLLPAENMLASSSFQSSLSQKEHQEQQLSQSLLSQVVSFRNKINQSQQTSDTSMFKVSQSLHEQHSTKQSLTASMFHSIQHLTKKQQDEQLSQALHAQTVQYMNKCFHQHYMGASTTQAAQSLNKQCSAANAQSLREQCSHQQSSEMSKFQTLECLNEQQLEQHFSDASALQDVQCLNKKQDLQSSEVSKVEDTQFFGCQQLDQQSLEAPRLQVAQLLSKQQIEQKSQESSKLQAAQFFNVQSLQLDQSLQGSKLQAAEILNVQELDQQSLQTLKLQAAQFVNVQEVGQQSLEASDMQSTLSLNRQVLEQQSVDHEHEVQQRSQSSINMIYQDMDSEIKLMTEEWQNRKELHSKKSSKWQISDDQSKGLQSTDLKDQEKSPRRKSIDEHIKDWLSPRKYSREEKSSQTKQLTQLPPEEYDEAQSAQKKKPQRQKSKDRRGEDPQRQEKKEEKKEKIPKEPSKTVQNKDQLRKDSLVPTIKSREPSKTVQNKDQLRKDSLVPTIKSREPSKTVQNKDQLRKDSLVPTSKSREPSETVLKKYQRKKVSLVPKISQMTQTEKMIQQVGQQFQTTTPQDVVKEIQGESALESKSMEKERKQEEPALESKSIEKERKQEEPALESKSVQTDDIKADKRQQLVPYVQKDVCQTKVTRPDDVKNKLPDSGDLMLEETKSDFLHSSGQSSVQDAYCACLYLLDSEQDVQANISTCSAADKDVASVSCCPRDEQEGCN